MTEAFAIAPLLNLFPRYSLRGGGEEAICALSADYRGDHAQADQ